jgi:hypothetical protein
MLALISINDMRCTNTFEIKVFLSTCTALGVFFGLVVSIVANNYDIWDKTRYLTTMGLRYLLAYKLVFYALSFTEGEYFNTSLILQDMKVADLSPNQVVWHFLGYTNVIPYLLGATMLLFATLLMFRKTSIIGAVGSLAIWTILSTINMAFDVCTLTATLGLLTVSSLIIWDGMPWLYAGLLGNVIKARKTYPFIRSSSHLYKSLAFLKAVLLIGSMAYFANQIWRSQKYFKSNKDNPIVGVWDIIDMQYESDTGSLSRDTIPLELAQFKSLFLEENRYGAVKVADDSLSMFEFIVDSNYHQLEFWNFFDYRDLDLKGKYQLTDKDTLIYSATNNKEKLRIVMKRNPRYRQTK